MMTKRLIPLLALAMSPLAGVSIALAADDVGQKAAMPAPAAAVPASKPGQMKPGPMQMMMEKRIADLHEKLKITPEQQTLWDDFAATMRENAVSTDQLIQARKEKDAESETALASMQAYQAMTQDMAHNIERLLPKFAALYNALTPEQKKTADHMFASYREQREQREHHMMMRKGQPE